MARILGKPKPPQEPGIVATSKLKKLPGKTKPPKLALKRGKNQSMAEPSAEPDPPPAKKSSHH